MDWIDHRVQVRAVSHTRQGTRRCCIGGAFCWSHQRKDSIQLGQMHISICDGIGQLFIIIILQRVLCIICPIILPLFCYDQSEGGVGAGTADIVHPAAGLAASAGLTITVPGTRAVTLFTVALSHVALLAGHGLTPEPTQTSPRALALPALVRETHHWEVKMTRAAPLVSLVPRVGNSWLRCMSGVSVSGESRGSRRSRKSGNGIALGFGHVIGYLIMDNCPNQPFYQCAYVFNYSGDSSIYLRHFRLTMRSVIMDIILRIRW